MRCAEWQSIQEDFQILNMEDHKKSALIDNGRKGRRDRLQDR